MKVIKSDAITRDMMEWLITYLSPKRAVVKQRTLLGMFILYCTGLRISELLLFRVMNLKELVQKGSTRITVLKSKGKTTISKHITPGQAKEIVNGRLSNAFNLMLDKKLDSDELFTTYTTGGPRGKKGKLILPKQLIREFNRELQIMNEVKFANKLRITSHGFRAGYITRRLRQTSVRNVASMVGHSSINSTFEYDRNIMTDLDVQHLQDSDWDFREVPKLLSNKTTTTTNSVAKSKVVKVESPSTVVNVKKDYNQLATDLVNSLKNKN